MWRECHTSSGSPALRFLLSLSRYRGTTAAVKRPLAHFASQCHWMYSSPSTGFDSATEDSGKLAKRNKNRSKNKADRARPREQDSRVREPERPPEPDGVQNTRLFYAGGAAVVGILVAVIIWFIIHRSSEDPGLRPPSPTTTLPEQKYEPGADSAKSSIQAPSSTKVLRDRLKGRGEGPAMVVIAAG